MFPRRDSLLNSLLPEVSSHNTAHTAPSLSNNSKSKEHAGRVLYYSFKWPSAISSFGKDQFRLRRALAWFISSNNSSYALMRGAGDLFDIRTRCEWLWRKPHPITSRTECVCTTPRQITHSSYPLLFWKGFSFLSQSKHTSSFLRT